MKTQAEIELQASTDRATASLRHFLKLARAGKMGGASTGAHRCFLLAKAALEYVPGLDGQARDGFKDFCEAVALMPETAAEMMGSR